MCNKTGFHEFLEATKKRLAAQKVEDANGFPPMPCPEFKAVGNPGIQVSSLLEFFSTPIISTNNEDSIYYEAVSGFSDNLEAINELSSVDREAITEPSSVDHEAITETSSVDREAITDLDTSSESSDVDRDASTEPESD